MIATSYIRNYRALERKGFTLLSVCSTTKHTTPWEYTSVLAPDPDWIFYINKNVIACRDAAEMYLRYLASIDTDTWSNIMKSLRSFDKVCLVSTARPGEWSFRHVLADYINMRFNVSISEVS